MDTKRHSRTNSKWRYTSLPIINPPKEKIDFQGLIGIGSCFARNFNRWLDYSGLIKEQMPWDILYNPFSMSMEIIRLFEQVDWQAGIISEKEDSKLINQFRDPWRTWASFNSISELERANDSFSRNAKKIIKQATCFLFTFGLSEIWSHKEDDNLIVNQLPLEIIKDVSSPWQSRFAEVDEIEGVVLRLVKTIKENYGSDFPIIFTVSPVPLKYTFSGLPIREANNISKSTILIALHKVINMTENIYYFPAYEIVQALVEQNFPVWQNDGRHVTAATVNLISNLLFDNFSDKKDRKKSFSDFWVPFVNSQGKITGRLYVNGEFSH
ncbi:hypothetical protein C0583_04500 [Candidatus Parcubacteria bacterium]|nr:MAG: hypothetical protein C0583_04500 [Candidatus Parcubacteria bacterium]